VADLRSQRLEQETCRTGDVQYHLYMLEVRALPCTQVPANATILPGHLPYATIGSERSSGSVLGGSCFHSHGFRLAYAPSHYLSQFSPQLCDGMDG